MNSIRSSAEERKATNAKALAALGLTVSQVTSAGYLRTIKTGGPATVFTVGYERRTAEDLMSRLRDAGIEVLADIREKPISRRPDFRADALRDVCMQATIDYQQWTKLGSTGPQRDRLRDNGNLEEFHKQFRAYAKRQLMPEVQRLAAEVQRRSVALLCYERAHEDCHRMVIAELIANGTGAGITAII